MGGQRERGGKGGGDRRGLAERDYGGQREGGRERLWGPERVGHRKKEMGKRESGVWVGGRERGRC